MERVSIPRQLLADFEAFLARHGWELRRGQMGLSAQRAPVRSMEPATPALSADEILASRGVCRRHQCLLLPDGRCLSCEAAGG